MENTKKWKTLSIISIIAIILIIMIMLVIFLLSNKKYEIIFNTDGGNYLSSIKVGRNKLAKKPNDPKKSGYKFLGWYLNDKAFDFNTKITSDLTLVAKWEELESVMAFKETNITMKTSESQELKLNISKGINYSDLLWISSNKDIVSVENGVIKALKAGTSTITAKTKDGKYSSNIEITVFDKEISVKSISLSGNSSVMVGKTIKLTATITPNDATNKNVTWRSNDNSIATVDNNGNILGIKVGSVTITATTVDGKSATKKINVIENTTKTTTTTQEPTTTTTTTTTTTQEPTTTTTTATTTAQEPTTTTTANY